MAPCYLELKCFKVSPRDTLITPCLLDKMLSLKIIELCCWGGSTVRIREPLGRPRGIGWRGRWEEGSGRGIQVNPWLIHVDVWQKPLQYCKVINLQLIKINEKKKIREPRIVLVQCSRSVVSDSLQPNGLQRARLPCPSPTPRACSNSCPLSQWCHPIISSSVVPFSSCLQSFPGSGSSPVSQLFASGGQSIGASASASVLPMNIQDWIHLGLTDLISLQSKGLSRVFSNTTVQKHHFFGI